MRFTVDQEISKKELILLREILTVGSTGIEFKGDRKVCEKSLISKGLLEEDSLTACLWLTEYGKRFCEQNGVQKLEYLPEFYNEKGCRIY